MFPVTRIWCRSTLLGCGRSSFFERLFSEQPVNGNQNVSLNLPESPKPPKKPMTAFFRYVRDIKPTLQQKNPNMKIQELTKLASELWKNETPEKKVEYETPYKEDMERFRKANTNYLESLSPEARLELKIQLIKKRADTIVKKLNKRAKDMGKPKRPPSGFALFIKSTQEERVKNSKSSVEWVSIQSKKWKELPIEEKQVHINESKKLASIYQAEIVKWEAEMVRKGNNDLLRNMSTLDLTKEIEKRK